jgi:hypothetical protein
MQTHVYVLHVSQSEDILKNIIDSIFRNGMIQVLYGHQKILVE